MDIDFLQTPKYLAPLPLDKEEAKEDKTDFSVLADRETVENIAKHISDKLRHPVTIIDINRLDDDQQDEEYQSKIRIDSDVSYLSLRNACKLFRCYAGAEKCYKCDHFHAAMLQGIVQTTTKDELDKKIQNEKKNSPPFFASSYTERELKTFEFSLKKPGTHRLVIEYHCPILGYRELEFPIFYNSKVIGILFVGQTIVRDKGDNEIIKKIQEEFFSEQENTLDVKLDVKTLKDRIFKADESSAEIEDWLRESPIIKGGTIPDMTFGTYEQYKNFISNVSKELSVIEEELKKGIKERREKYFDSIVQSSVDNYLIEDKVNSEDTYKQQLESLENAWHRFFEATERIKKDLELDDIVLFGDGIKMNAMKAEKKSVYKNTEEELYYDEWEYDFSALKNKNFAYEPRNSLSDDSLFDGLCDKIDRTNVILLVYPDIVMLLKVKDLNNYHDIYVEMTNCIGKGFANIYSDIALRAANFMKERYMFTLRMYRHESAHISTRLNDNIKQYFVRSATKFVELEQEKRKLVIDDMAGAISLISHMANNIGILTGRINEETTKRKNVNVRNLLFKWQVMFRDALYGKNLDIKVQEENKIEAPDYLMTNPDLFELLLYNLVDNAVKYAYRGSCSAEDRQYFELTVSSYGQNAEGGTRLYDLYTRGENRENDEEGDGMGLYIVKRICEILKFGGISHDSIEISKYNIPLVLIWLIRLQSMK